MGWKRDLAAAVVAVGFGLAANMAQAAPAGVQQCKKDCTTAYSGCIKRSSEEACRKTWIMCKNKCNPAPAKSTPAPAAPPPKKG